MINASKKLFGTAFLALTLTAAFFFMSVSDAAAMGILLPKDKSLPALAIKSHRVEVKINDQGAHTTVDQVFMNHTNRDLEAVYLFPLPKGAASTDFALWMNGKRVKGEVLGANEAKQIYRGIVLRMKDPGLLEYVGGNLFRASIYPVPRKGEQRVQISYAQVVPYDSGICHYVYPLRTDRKAARTIEDFTVSVDIKSSAPIRSVYSPSHETSVTRDGDNHVVTGFEQNAALLDRDFSLYYTLSEKDVGISLLTHRDAGDGYFMLMITPGVDPAADKILPKDVLFVIDTSGSMRGEKIEKAKEALGYCLDALRPKDRYGIVRFSDGIEPMSKTLLEATTTNKNKGQKFVKNMRAVGGTNINQAMLTALANPKGENRPGIIVFLTDGQPTVGVTKMKEIVRNLDGANMEKWRIFSFGVGTSINTHLLDKISGNNGGVTEYVRPDDEIERQISGFFNKIEKPVLTDVSVDFRNAKVTDVFPRKMPDLFAGTQLVLLGRFRDSVETAVILEGQRTGARTGTSQDVSYPGKNKNNSFIKQLWATRKVGYLLDEIRLNGQNSELVAEVTHLGKEFGIVTPYTSYLVTEAMGHDGNGRFRRTGGMDVMDSSAQMPTPDMAAPGPVTLRKESKSKNGIGSLGGALRSRRALEEKSGEGAVATGKTISRMKDSDRADDESGLTRYSGAKTFVWKAGYYVDTKHKDGNALLKVKYGSDAYFRILELYPEAKKYLALGQKVIFSCTGNKSIVIDSGGLEEISDSKLKSFLP